MNNVNMSSQRRRLDPLIRQLSDKQEIAEVIARFCRGVDRLDRHLIRSSYHDDAYDDHGSALSGPADEFVDALVKVCAQYYTASSHLVCNQLIELDGESAYCETYYVGALTWQGPSGPVRNISHARYIDRLEWRPIAGWRIAYRRAVLDWSDDSPRPWSGLGPALATRGRCDRGDPSYQRSPAS